MTGTERTVTGEERVPGRPTWGGSVIAVVLGAVIGFVVSGLFVVVLALLAGSDSSVHGSHAAGNGPSYDFEVYWYGGPWLDTLTFLAGGAFGLFAMAQTTSRWVNRRLPFWPFLLAGFPAFVAIAFGIPDWVALPGWVVQWSGPATLVLALALVGYVRFFATRVREGGFLGDIGVPPAAAWALGGAMIALIGYTVVASITHPVRVDQISYVTLPSVSADSRECRTQRRNAQLAFTHLPLADTSPRLGEGDKLDPYLLGCGRALFLEVLPWKDGHLPVALREVRSVHSSPSVATLAWARVREPGHPFEEVKDGMFDLKLGEELDSWSSGSASLRLKVEIDCSKASTRLIEIDTIGVRFSTVGLSFNQDVPLDLTPVYARCQKPLR